MKGFFKLFNEVKAQHEHILRYRDNAVAEKFQYLEYRFHGNSNVVAICTVAWCAVYTRS